jgi:hydroxypyruvate reductase
MSIDHRHLLRAMFQAAVNAAAPAMCVPPHLPPRPIGRTIVVGAGKAAAAMAAVVEAHWNAPLQGLVVTPYGHAKRCKHIEVVEASHPVPDEAGAEAARGILRKISGLTADDLVLVLMSGGGSALLALPAPGLTLAEKQAINRALLRCGANIAEINVVRKHLSAIKGGRLALAAAPAQVVTLAISDVPGDDLSAIASGPTAPDISTRNDAVAVLKKYGIEIPAKVAMHLNDQASETPKPGHPCFANVT